MVNQESIPGNPDENPDDLKIMKHGHQRRATITVPLVVGVDDDIIADLNALDRLERQSAVKDAIREGRPKLKASKIQPSAIVEKLNEIHNQTKKTNEGIEYIKTLFTVLSDWLEERFSKLGRVSYASSAVDETTSEDNAEGRATEEQLAARKANLAKKKWK